MMWRQQNPFCKTDNPSINKVGKAAFPPNEIESARWKREDGEKYQNTISFRYNEQIATFIKAVIRGFVFFFHFFF